MSISLQRRDHDGGRPGARDERSTRRLTFRDVGMTFPDGTAALKDVNLQIEAGEFVSIVGPSGCGKSTVLRIASGLEAPSHGELETTTSGIGYVFQDPTLLPWRNVHRNIALLAELRGIPPRERAEKVAAAIELVGLTGFEGHLPRQLSGGMRMRASLARALTLDPGLFLFDEPFGALDEITRERLNDELARLFMRRRFAGLFITHSVSEAVFLSTRVVVMSGRPGGIVESFDVPFAYPREPELRFDPDFARLAGAISGTLKKGVR